MYNRSMKRVLKLLTISLFFVPFLVGAQVLFDLPTGNDLINTDTGLPKGVVEQLSIDVIPEIPQPNEEVTISVESFSANLGAATFSWSVNGVQQEAGKGITQFTFNAPDSGEEVSVRLIIQKAEGGTIERNFSFAPSNVDLIYEAETYVPPFYKGKSLYTNASLLRFIALPNFVVNGVKINDKNLVYKWYVNGSADQDNSGYGKNVFYYQGTLIERPVNIEVEVMSEDTTLTGKEDITVYPDLPEILIYEDNPILGIIFEKVVEGNFLLNRPEINLESIPYNFSVPQRDSYLIDYVWKMNGERIITGYQNNSVTLRNETGEEGLAVINLETNHFDKLLQTAATSLVLNFQEQNVSTSDGNSFEF
jgi:hypothetical protein